MEGIDRLVQGGTNVAMIAGADYLRRQGQEPSARSKEFCMHLRSILPGHFREALRDAKQAFEANMGQAAEATFRASMVQAGILAAKMTLGEVNADIAIGSSVLME